MLHLLLMQIPTTPFYIGPWGAALATAVIVVLAILSYKRGTWKSTADSAVLEMNVYKGMAERLREEKKGVEDSKIALVEKISKLEAATDLKPLAEAIHVQQNTIAAWVGEGRERFTKTEVRLDQIHSENTKALTAVLEEVRAQRIMSEDAYRQLNVAFHEHTIEDHQVTLENKEVNFRFANMLDVLERRVSETAVQIGHVKWTARADPPASARREHNGGQAPSERPRE